MKITEPTTELVPGDITLFFRYATKVYEPTLVYSLAPNAETTFPSYTHRVHLLGATRSHEWSVAAGSEWQLAAAWEEP